MSTTEITYATRATQREAKAHFDAGGAVLVSEHGHETTRPVGPMTVTNTSETTTWSALVEGVRTWRNRYPNQRFYLVPVS